MCSSTLKLLHSIICMVRSIVNKPRMAIIQISQLQLKHGLKLLFLIFFFLSHVPCALMKHGQQFDLEKYSIFTSIISIKDRKQNSIWYQGSRSRIFSLPYIDAVCTQFVQFVLVVLNLNTFYSFNQLELYTQILNLVICGCQSFFFPKISQSCMRQSMRQKSPEHDVHDLRRTRVVDRISKLYCLYSLYPVRTCCTVNLFSTRK